MDDTTGHGKTAALSDALVIFGATGDLAQRKIYPALEALAQHGRLDMPVVAIARGDVGGDDGLRNLVRRSIERAQVQDAGLVAKMRYLRGDYLDKATYQRLGEMLNGARKPLFYLAIPPSTFPDVVRCLGRASLAHGRVVVEKPF
ncbi:MAG: hypothetical protein JO157_08805, partial [Acetobacteraceae bacterium]|nr:hypothetical protein [Acetobacteraceae bacterium]